MDSPGERLRAWRKHRGLKAAQLAEDLGISISGLARLESGERLPGRRLANAIEQMTEREPEPSVIRARHWDAEVAA